MSYIFISKEVLQDNGWHISKSADAYDKTEKEKYRPSVVGYCPACDEQHSLLYQRQTEKDVIFSCLKCMRGF